MSKSNRRRSKPVFITEDTKITTGGKNPITRNIKPDMAAAQNRKPILPLNERQKEYIEALQNEDVTTILVTGVLGSSKTFLPSAIAADMLIDGKLDKVVIARPAEGKAKTVGFTKGDFNQKLAGWCAPITDTMKQRMGAGNFEAALEYEKIVLLPLEQVKGRSWDDAWIIADEFEDVEVDTAKSLVTRVGQRSKIILTGDIAQQDLKKFSGMQYLLDVSKKLNLPITHIDFNHWDYCVRSEEAKMWGKAFEEYDKNR